MSARSTSAGSRLGYSFARSRVFAMKDSRSRPSRSWGNGVCVTNIQSATWPRIHAIALAAVLPLTPRYLAITAGVRPNCRRCNAWAAITDRLAPQLFSRTSNGSPAAVRILCDRAHNTKPSRASAVGYYPPTTHFEKADLGARPPWGESEGTPCIAHAKGTEAGRTGSFRFHSVTKLDRCLQTKHRSSVYRRLK